MEPDFQIFHIPDPNKCVFGPGDAWACPRIYRFILKSENVGQTISDPGQKLIVYTLPSIWQYPFFQNDIQIKVFCQNRQIQKFRFFCCIELPIGLPIVPLCCCAMVPATRGAPNLSTKRRLYVSLPSLQRP